MPMINRVQNACVVALTVPTLLLANPNVPEAQAAAATAEKEVLKGIPRVVDGDTLVLNDTRIRMFGYDAPETKQVCLDAKGKNYNCGEAATQALQKRVGRSGVTCTVRNKDLYHRSVASCTIEDAKKEDMGDFMVSSGNAVAYRQYSKKYVSAEDSARSGKVGLWSGSFEEPAQWRKEKKAGTRHPELVAAAVPAPPLTWSASDPNPTKVPFSKTADSDTSKLPFSKADFPPLPSPSVPPASGGAAPMPKLNPPPVRKVPEGGSAPPPGGCAIKGNISGSNRIFHVPGGASYDKTVIDTTTGERWFCSEQEALDAGWRKASR